MVDDSRGARTRAAHVDPTPQWRTSGEGVGMGSLTLLVHKFFPGKNSF